MVERLREDLFQAGLDPHAAGARLLERSLPECPIEALAHGFQVDPECGERLRIDRGRRRADTRAPDLLIDRVGWHAKQVECVCHRTRPVAGHGEQHVLAADVVIAAASGLPSPHPEVAVQVAHRRRLPPLTKQPHRRLPRVRRSPLPYFWWTACLETPSSSAIRCQLHPSSRARRTCSASTASSRARNDAAPRSPISGSSLAVCVTTSLASSTASR